MPVVLTCFFFWFAAIVLETTVFTLSSWFHPNLLFLVSTILCLHWRGNETIFLAILFGIAADCFSTIPFGMYALTFFIISFFSRWYGIKVFQGSYPILVIYSAVATIAMNCLVYFLLNFLFSSGRFSLDWLMVVLFEEALPTMVVAIPVFWALQKVEAAYRIRLAERKF